MRNRVPLSLWEGFEYPVVLRLCHDYPLRGVRHQVPHAQLAGQTSRDAEQGLQVIYLQNFGDQLNVVSSSLF